MNNLVVLNYKLALWNSIAFASIADYLITRHYLKMPGIGVDGEINPLLRYMIETSGSFEIIFIIKVITLMASFFAVLCFTRPSTIISFTIVIVLALQIAIVAWGLSVVLCVSG